jgi:hypothetical protein
MSENLLKSNFPTGEVKKDADAAPTVAEELKKKALESLGGSMVYVDRTLTWDPKK